MPAESHDWYHFAEKDAGGGVVENGYVCRRCFHLAIIAGAKYLRTPAEEAATVAMLNREPCPGDRRRELEAGGTPALYHRWQRFRDVDRDGRLCARGYTCLRCGNEFFTIHRDMDLLTGTEAEEETRFATRARDRECKGQRVRELGERLAGQP